MTEAKKMADYFEYREAALHRTIIELKAEVERSRILLKRAAIAALDEEVPHDLRLELYKVIND